jgi:hypothetical protein
MDDDELRQLVERLMAERESADQDAMAVFREAQVKGTDADGAFAEAAQVKYLLMGKLMVAGIPRVVAGQLAAVWDGVV